MSGGEIFFEGLHAYTLDDKGVLVIGLMPEQPLAVGDRLVFTNVKGKHRRTTVRAIVHKPVLNAPKDSDAKDTFRGIVVDEIERSEIKTPVIFQLERKAVKRRVLRPGEAAEAAEVAAGDTIEDTANDLAEEADPAA